MRSILEALLDALLPAVGRHRASARHARRTPADPPTHTPTPAPTEEPVTRPTRVNGPVTRGEDIGVVRPYLVAHEREQHEAQRRQTCRRTLLLAPRGVDMQELMRRDLRVAA
jgi:hypothetical protein